MILKKKMKPNLKNKNRRVYKWIQNKIYNSNDNYKLLNKIMKQKQKNIL